MRLKNIKKEKKGISLVVLLIVIGVMLILLSTITISLDNIVTNSKKRQFAKEIYEIQSMVDTYKKQNDDYPYIKLAEGNKTIDLEVTNGNENQVAIEDVIDDKVTLYVINMQKIGANELSRGYNQNGDETDVYAFSNKTGIVYYVKGYSVRRNTYYTLTDELRKLIGLNTSNSSSSGIIKGEIDLDKIPYEPNGLVLYLDGINNTLNEHSDSTDIWYDLSGNGNNLTLENVSWTDDSAVFNNSLAYTDNTVENITVEMVVKQNENTNGYIYVGYFGNNQHLITLYDNNKLLFSHNNKFYQGFNNYRRNTVCAIFETSQGVVENSFLNSVRLSKTADSTTWTSNLSHYIQIGKYTDNQWRFAGEICAIRIYNRALTEEEIKHNYNIDKERFNLE